MAQPKASASHLDPSQGRKRRPSFLERLYCAVMGAAKVPTLRNAELTQPFFHNGGALNLRQVVEFYIRGGNHKSYNINDFDADIRPIGLSVAERAQLIEFVKSLTDDRVRRDAAPFDHPELTIPVGHIGDESSV